MSRQVKLRDVVEINPTVKVGDCLDEHVSFLAMADVSEQGRITNLQQRSLAEVRKGYTPFCAGDVLLAKITPCFENGKAAVVEKLPTRLGFGSTEFHVLRPSAEIDARFLFHLIWNPGFRRIGASRMTGSAGQKRVPTTFLAEYEFTLPSLEEQKRIAAILDKAESLRCKRLEAIRIANNFLRAVFVDMFAGRDRNTVITNYCDFLTGFAFKSDQYVPALGAARLLRGINVGVGGFEWKDSAGYPFDSTIGLERYRLESGDVVLAMDRPWISSGLKCAIVDETVAGDLLVQRVARLRPKSSEYGAFVFHCLQGNDFKSHCRITETTIPHISPKDFATFPVVVATDEELRTFAEIAKKVQGMISKKNTAANSTNRLCASLQAQLIG